MKKVDQILKNGEIISDFDETIKPTQIEKLYKSIFQNDVRKDKKQYIVYDKVAIISANITNLGNHYSKYKKRMQLKQYYKAYFSKNCKNNLITIYVGIYSYKQTKLFVIFEPQSYQTKSFNNASAQIYSVNLQYAQKGGNFSKSDRFGNIIHIFKLSLFKNYVTQLANKPSNTISYNDIINEINNYFLGFFKKNIGKTWFGKNAYQEMSKNNYRNYRQNRWQGFYFEYLFESYLHNNKINTITMCNNKKKGGIDFDFKFSNYNHIFGDLKVDRNDGEIIGNKISSFDDVINKYNGEVYYICAMCKCEKDSNHNYEVTEEWNNLRDAKKQYKNKNDMINGFGKLMNYSVTITEFNILKIDKTMLTVLKQDPFNQGKNSNGKKRKPKIKINRKLIDRLSIFNYK